MPKLSKATEQEILEAYEALAEGDSVQPLVERFSVSRQTIYNVLYRHGREPHRRRPASARTITLPEDVVAFLQMVTWRLDGLVDDKVVSITLDNLKDKYGLD